MAYQALYNKYRPQTFEQVVGQKAIVKTIQNSLRDDKIGHGYLFCGPRGTGKTSMARLFAKALDCKQGLGKQCMECDSCKAVANGTHPDVIEIDAASNSGVDNVRDLITQVNYQPLMGRYKIYIIDECHNMTEPAFNALLKTLEEPPSYVIFVLCTTEPQAILPTILSRVQRFDFSKVDDSQLAERIELILKEENVKYTKDAVKKIVELSDGGVRDALSVLDQAVSFGGSSIDESTLETLFGLLDITNKMDLVKLVHEGKLAELLKKVRSFYERGMDIVRVAKELEGIYKDIIIRSFDGEDDLLNELSVSQAETLSYIGREEAQRNIQELIKAQRDFRYAQDILDVFELTLMRMCSEETVEKPEVKKVERPAPIKEETKEVSIPFTPLMQAKEEKVIENKIEGPKKEEVKEEKIVSSSKTDDGTVLSIMKKGDKAIKKQYLLKWEDMDGSIDSRECLLALGDCKPCVASEDSLVLSTNSNEAKEVLENQANKEKLDRIFQQNFEKTPRLVVITDDDFKRLCDMFRNGVTVEPVKEETKKEEKSNADIFLEQLKGGF